ncbi:MAG: hypothetical protein RR483_04245, partial [Clostridia bacterium]
KALGFIDFAGSTVVHSTAAWIVLAAYLSLKSKYKQEIIKKDMIFEDYKILIMPDHPTPLSIKTHTRDAVPFLIYQKSIDKNTCFNNFNETACEKANFIIENCQDLENLFLK